MVLLLISLWLPPEAGAGFWEKCQSLFHRAEPQALPSEELRLWGEAFPGTHPYFAQANGNEDFFWFAYARLPEKLRLRLESLPVDQKLAHQQVSAWVKDSLPPSSFLDQIFVFLRSQPEGAANPLAKGHADFQRKILRDPTLQVTLEAELKDSFQAALAQQKWVQGNLGAASFPVVEREGKSFLFIGDKEIEFEVSGEEYLLFVPKESVQNAAWNPVAKEKVAEMMEAGVKAPEEYRAGLGHNGIFYPDDGNHRLHLDPRSLIPVRVSSLKTLNLRLMFDYVGIEQPSAEKIRAYAEGKISWEMLLSSPAQKRFFLVSPGNALP